MATCKHEEIAPVVRDLYIEGFTRKKISELLKIDQDLVGYILYVQLKIHERIQESRQERIYLNACQRKRSLRLSRWLLSDTRTKRLRRIRSYRTGM